MRSAGYKSLILITERGAGPTQAAASVATASDPLHISIDDSPSSLCDSKICAKYQSRINGPAFECFRPFVGPPLALPASLISPIFAAFLLDCDADLASLGRCELESICAMTLLEVMPSFYKKEAERQVLVNRALSTFLGQQLTLLQPNVEESTSRSDGGLVVSADGIDALVLLTEHKTAAATRTFSCSARMVCSGSRRSAATPTCTASTAAPRLHWSLLGRCCE